MIEIIQSETFRKWFGKLRDPLAKARITDRVLRLENDAAGDIKSVGEGVSEIRFHFGPGYRIYFLKQGAAFVVLLCGGDKSSQKEDIRQAKRFARQWRLNHD
jgi:putative addiction module killer protein